jgi:chorismate mutase
VKCLAKTAAQGFDNGPRPPTGDAAFFVIQANSGDVTSMKIIDWRSKIDAIDTALLHLLNLRTELALEVGRLKADEGVSLRVPAREQEILSRMKSLNPGPLAIDSIAKIYQVILDESIRTQEQYGFGAATYSVPARPQQKGSRKK